MAYAIEIARPAQRQLKKLDAPIRRKVSRRIDGLATDPRPSGVVKLTNFSPPIYRVREGHYRVLFTIDDDKLIVLVVRVAHRSDAYR
jgi:mRNA interferase RelE/StbE